MSEPATGISYEVIYEGFTVTYAVYQAEGPAGTDGLGVPAGGTTGQVLAKVSNADNDTTWVTDASGIGEAPEDGTAYRRKDAAWEADPNQIELGPAIGSIISDLDTHVNDTSNPHAVTAAQAQAAPETVIPDYLAPQALVPVGGNVTPDASLGSQMVLTNPTVDIVIGEITNVAAGTSGTIRIVNDNGVAITLDSVYQGYGGMESELSGPVAVLTWFVTGPASVICFVSTELWTGTGV